MSYLHIGDAAQAVLNQDARGCYVGNRALRIETSATTCVVFDPRFDFTKRVKVPAKELARLIYAGMDDFILHPSKLVARRAGFMALLPYAEADPRDDDLLIRDHIVLASESIVEVLGALECAAAFCDPKATHMAYRFVYAKDHHVFASDGSRMFVARLAAPLEFPMVFNAPALLDLVRWWRDEPVDRVRYSAHSLMLKNTAQASEIRCVDTIAPSELHRAAVGLSMDDIGIEVDTARLREALVCALLVSDTEQLQLSIQAGQYQLGSHNSQVAIPTVSSNGAPALRITVDGLRLLRSLRCFKADRIWLASSAGFKRQTLLMTSPGTNRSVVHAVERRSAAIPMLSEVQLRKHPLEPAARAHWLTTEVLQEMAFTEMETQLRKSTQGDPDAQAWLHAASDAPLGFERLCSLLGVDPEVIRAEVIRMATHREAA